MRLQHPAVFLVNINSVKLNCHWLEEFSSFNRPDSSAELKIEVHLLTLHLNLYFAVSIIMFHCADMIS